MHVALFALGLVLYLGVILDVFHTIILPRRPSARFRLTRVFYVLTRKPFFSTVDRVRNQKMRDQLLSTFGPASLILLLGVWASVLVVAYTFMFSGLGSPFTDRLEGVGTLPPWVREFRMDLYVSGTSLFTLGLGDVIPATHFSRLLLVLESGTGLGLMAIVIGYLPAIYQAFSKREVGVAMLDARAGSPPSASLLLGGLAFDGGQRELIDLLKDWERWAAELLESHLSHPVLCYYRSQHNGQSWLSALVAVMDICALLIATVDAGDYVDGVRQAKLTFEVGRNALLDLAHVFRVSCPDGSMAAERRYQLSLQTLSRMSLSLSTMQLPLREEISSARRLSAIQSLYEPHATALAAYLRMPIPQWIEEAPVTEDLWAELESV